MNITICSFIHSIKIYYTTLFICGQALCCDAILRANNIQTLNLSNLRLYSNCLNILPRHIYVSFTISENGTSHLLKAGNKQEGIKNIWLGSDNNRKKSKGNFVKNTPQIIGNKTNKNNPAI